MPTSVAKKVAGTSGRKKILGSRGAPKVFVSHSAEASYLIEELEAIFKRIDAMSERQHRTLDELIPKLQTSRLSAG